MDPLKESTQPDPLHIPRPHANATQVIHGRQVHSPFTMDANQTPPIEYIAKAFAQMQRHLQDIVKGEVDETKVFDEYLAQGLAGYATSAITIQPTYEYTERVEAIIITGPAGAVTLQLGDRGPWSLTIPAAGILVIAPVAIYLGRNDIRSLTAASAGDFTLELMGHADTRWSV